MGGRLARWIVVTVVVILVLLVGADRIGRYFAERAAADTLESSEHLSSRPGVDIAGFPFLTQVISRKFDRITVTAKDVPVGQQSQPLVISRLRVVLHTLTVSGDFHRLRAKSGVATAQITFGELGDTLGISLSYAGDGRIKATKTVQVAGTALPATLTTRPQLAGDALTFTQTSIDNVGALGTDVANQLGRVFRLALPLQDIPFHVQVRDLTVGQNGVALTLSGQDLSYTR